MEIALPAPCAVCAGPVSYSGRGRRPEICSPACRRAQRAADQRERRAAGRPVRAEVAPAIREYLERRRERNAAAPYVLVVRADDDQWAHIGELVAEAAGEGNTFNLGTSGYVPDGWAERNALPRDRDEAAQWLAAYFPEELATFPLAT